MNFLIPRILLFPIFLAISFRLCAAPGDLKWTFLADGPIRSSPALSTNGYLYFGATSGTFYSINAATGMTNWRASANVSASSPAIGPDGTVFIGTAGAQILALDGLTGKQRWVTSLPDQMLSSPALAANGRLYATVNGFLLAFDSRTGKQQWQNQVDGFNLMYGSPSVGAGGVVFFTTGSPPWGPPPPGRCFAVDGLTGRILWTFDSGNFIESSPAIGADGTVFVPSYDKLVYALDPLTGAKKWAHLTGDSISSSPAIGPDGTLYVGSNDGKLYALDGKTGSEKWAFQTVDTIHSSPAIAADGTVYFGSYDNTVYAVDGKTGAEKWRFTTQGEVLSSPVIGPDGTVYIGSHDGHLYALVGSSGPAAGPWSAFKGGPQRTSSSERDGAPVFIQAPENMLAAEGSSTFLDAVVQGTRPMSFQWLRDGRLLTNSSISRLEIPAAQLSDNGQYTLIASNSLGAVSSTARLDVGFALTMTTSQGGMVTRKPDQEVYLPGSLVELTATPEPGRTFRGWAGSLSGLKNPYLLIVTGSQTVMANFTVLPGDPLWQFAAQPQSEPSVAVANDNTVFIPDNNQISALEGGTGLLKWSFTAGSRIIYSPAVGRDGTLLFAAQPNFLYALDGAKGTKKWIVGGIPLAIDTSPAVASDGTIYVGSRGHSLRYLSSLDPNSGALNWSFSTSDTSSGGNKWAPRIGTNGLIYIDSVAGLNVKISGIEAASGQSRWLTTFPGSHLSAAALGRDNAIYVQSQDGFLHALNGNTGSELWNTQMPAAGDATPIVGPDDTIYVINSGSATAVDARSGQIKTAFAPSIHLNLLGTTPALAADQTLYALAPDKLLALDSVNGAVKWAASVPGLWGPVTLAPDGTLYLSGQGTNGQPIILALHGGSPLADSPWAEYGGNARNSGALNDSPFARILRVARSAADVTLTIRTRANSIYHLEFKNSLSEPAWTPGTDLTGNEGDQVFIDPQTPKTQRFYRVRAE